MQFSTYTEAYKKFFRISFSFPAIKFGKFSFKFRSQLAIFFCEFSF